MKKYMATMWGTLDEVYCGCVGDHWVQVRIVLPGGLTIRIRAVIGHLTTVARGIERVDPSNLREGESVELSYHCGRDGFLEAETIYVHPDEATVS